MRKTFFIIVALLCAALSVLGGAASACAAPAGIETDVVPGEMAFLRARVTGTGVNLRQGPSVATASMGAANTGDVFIVESDRIKNEEDGHEWYRIVSAPSRRSAKMPLYISSKYVAPSPITRTDAASLAMSEIYRGWGDAARTERAKSGGWREFYENCAYWIGANVHEMRRLWPNGQTSRKIDAGYAGDMADYFSELDYSFPESHTFETVYKADGFEATLRETVASLSPRYASTRSFEQVVVTKRGADICGVAVGRTARDELVSRFGAPASEADGRMRYPGIYTDGERAGDDLLPYFYVDFTIEGGVVTKIEIALWPVG